MFCKLVTRRNHRLLYSASGISMRPEDKEETGYQSEFNQAGRQDRPGDFGDHPGDVGIVDCNLF